MKGTKNHCAQVTLEGNAMSQKKFRLSARISSDNPRAIESILEKYVAHKRAIKSTEDGFEVQAELKGENARMLNRLLLSELRRAEKRTRIRAEWTSAGMIERFFDYVPKGSRKLRHREH